MYKLAILALLGTFLNINNAQAQARDFDGIWSGTITDTDGDDHELTLYIDDNNVYAVYIDEDGDRAKYRGHEVLFSKGFGEQLNFIWMDKGGVWTETQVYSLVMLDDDRISVYHMRHVSNEDEYDTNTDWGYSSKGILRKE